MGVILDEYGDDIHISATDRILLLDAKGANSDEITNITGIAKGYVNKVIKRYHNLELKDKWRVKWQKRMMKYMLIGKIVGNCQFSSFLKSKDGDLFVRVIGDKGKGGLHVMSIDMFASMAILMWYEEIYGQ